jgi:DNA-binding Xre family transcriptional regulator
MKLQQSIASRINQLMQEREMTKEDLAQKAQLPLQMVENILSCKYKNVGLHTIFVICRAMDIFLKDFFQTPIAA